MSPIHSCQTWQELLHLWTSELPRGILWVRIIRPGAGYNFLAVEETFLSSHLGTSGTLIRVHPGYRCMQTPTWMHADAGRASRLSRGYWSRSLSESDKNFTTIEKNCLANVWGALNVRIYIIESLFSLRTGQNSLQWSHNLSYASKILARLRMRLPEF